MCFHELKTKGLFVIVVSHVLYAFCVLAWFSFMCKAKNLSQYGQQKCFLSFSLCKCDMVVISGVCGCFAGLSSSANAPVKHHHLLTCSLKLQFSHPDCRYGLCISIPRLPKVVKVKLVNVFTDFCTYQPGFPSTQKSSKVCQPSFACSGYCSACSLESLNLPFCCR